MKKIKALSLFSGGLDSILATRVVMAQGIEVEAIQFVTPFFNYDILEDVAAHKRKMLAQYGIMVEVEDISTGYLQLLQNHLQLPLIHIGARYFGRHQIVLAVPLRLVS